MAQPPPRRDPAAKRRGRRSVPVQATKIRELREQMELDVPGFAKQIGISTQHMYNLENGWKKCTSPKVARRIATALKVDYTQIVDAA